MTQTLDGSILGKITEADNLPSLPAVALQVLRLIRQEDVAVTEIAHTIEQDPALSAKILKAVNSPLFGMPNNVSSLPQAIVVLGLRPWLSSPSLDSISPKLHAKPPKLRRRSLR